MPPKAYHEDSRPDDGDRENRKNGEPADSTSGGEYQTCPECECPHVMTDKICSFCGAKLTNRVSLAEKARRGVETARWRYKLSSKSKSPGVLAKKAVKDIFALSLGLGLITIGVWLVAEGGYSKSFSYFIIGLLLLFYGGLAVYKTVQKQG